MQRLTSACLAVLAVALASNATGDDLLGFDAAGSAAQRSLEAEFDTHLSAEDMETWLRQMSVLPGAKSLTSRQSSSSPGATTSR